MKRILAAALLLLSPTVWADSGVFVVKSASGEAAIVNGDKKAAEQEAKEKALRDAVEKGAGTVIDSATMVEGGVAVSDKIFSHANGYVKHFEVAESKDQGDGTWAVSLENVEVATGDMSKDVAAIRANIIKQGHPRIMLMIAEQSVEEATPRGWWVQGQANPTTKSEQHNAMSVSSGVVEQEIISHLAPLGWKFVDPQVAAGKIKVSNPGTTDLNNTQVREFGKLTGAEYVVVGTVLVRPEENSEGLGTKGLVFPVNYRLSMRVVATDNGDILASSNVNGNFPNFKKNEFSTSTNDSSAKAMMKGATEIADELQKKVLARWQARDHGDDNIHVVVAAADFNAVDSFKAVLAKSVKDVGEPSFEEGRADFSIMMTGASPSKLASQLEGKKVNGGLTVKVTKVTKNTLEVKLAK